MNGRPTRVGDGDHPDDEVDEASMDSFPASDPPGWWAGHDAPRRAEASVGGLTEERIVDQHLATILSQVLDLLYQAKQAAWSATRPPLRTDLQDLVSFLIDQSRVVMAAEERIDGRASDIASPSSHQRGNIVAAAHGDIHLAASMVIDQLDALVDDIRARSATFAAAREATMLRELADGLARRGERIRSV